MKLEMLAIASEDGWAFVKQGDKLMLLRPPYRQENRSFVSEATLEKAVNHHGFKVERGQFDDWKGLIHFLQNRLVEARKALGYPSLGDRAGQELLRRAPKEIVARFLDRIESELLPTRQWEVAFEILTVLLKAQSIIDNSELISRVSDLLQQCSEIKTQLQNNPLELLHPTNASTQFSNAYRHFEEESIVSLSYKDHESAPQTMLNLNFTLSTLTVLLVQYLSTRRKADTNKDE